MYRISLPSDKILAFVAYIGFLYGPIQMFAITFLQFQRSVIAAKRITAFLDEEAEDETPGRTFEFRNLRGDIRFDRVRYDYGDGKDVLHDVSFSIRSGEKIAFVGRSGAGKSTLVHLILGLYMPKSGRIDIDGVDLSQIRLKTLRDRIGIVAQNIFLFDDTILNNIKYSRPEAKMEEVVAAAEASGCREFISRFPEGYLASVGEVGKKLSGGEKQRISIARCLLKKPDILIFDEPTAHLDTISVKNLTASIQNLFRDQTCLIISHHLASISWTDRIYVLDNGRLVQEGTSREL
jgi:ABC-type multidrug transport system fused ATPase/permease subunit